MENGNEADSHDKSTIDEVQSEPAVADAGLEDMESIKKDAPQSSKEEQEKDEQESAEEKSEEAVIQQSRQDQPEQQQPQHESLEQESLGQKLSGLESMQKQSIEEKEIEKPSETVSAFESETVDSKDKDEENVDIEQEPFEKTEDQIHTSADLLTDKGENQSAPTVANSNPVEVASKTGISSETEVAIEMPAPSETGIASETEVVPPVPETEVSSKADVPEVESTVEIHDVLQAETDAAPAAETDAVPAAETDADTAPDVSTNAVQQPEAEFAPNADASQADVIPTDGSAIAKPEESIENDAKKPDEMETKSRQSGTILMYKAILKAFTCNFSHRSLQNDNCF